MRTRLLDGMAWIHGIKSLLALSAAVSLEALDKKNAHGNYLFARGRHKYFGIGALVIFFAVFSGYGMAHMLATMVNVSTTGAIVAGSLWGLFQWCLERQMIMSIQADSSTAAKLLGFNWRAMLALLSATTMVYPFFVDSNRAEIDVRVGEMARSRQIQNLQTAHAATGLPALEKTSAVLGKQLEMAEQASFSDPPDVAIMRQQLALCRERARDQERKGLRQIRLWQQALTANPDTSPEAANLRKKISQQQLNMDMAKRLCQRDEQLINNKILAWRTEKLAEKTQLTAQFQRAQSNIDMAEERSSTMAQNQYKKIELAAQSGFAADFAAVWDMLQNDVYRRVQFIWWLLWFLAIELVAIIVKFSSSTDVDARLQADEALLKLDISSNRDMQAADLHIAQLRHAMYIQGEEIALQADAGKTTAAQRTIQQLCNLQQATANVTKNSHVPEAGDILQQTIVAIQASYLRLVRVQ